MTEPAKGRKPREQQRLEKRVVQKPDGRYLVFYEPKRPREGKG